MSYQKKLSVIHPFPPFFDEVSEILILGSFPSVRSRETGFFYGHPQNRFWKVTSSVFGCSEPLTVAEKKAFLTSQHIALWDVIASCEITGSSDVSIENAVPNDISVILGKCRIKGIFVNGKTAFSLYEKYIFPHTGVKASCMPSTSPANASWTVERLCKAWGILKDCRDGK